MSKRHNVWFPDRIHEQLVAEAAARRMSVADVVRQLVAAGLGLRAYDLYTRNQEGGFDRVILIQEV